MTNHLVSIIVAHSRNMAIGKANSLIWDLPHDRKRFKELSMGHPIIMGRKTWESLPERVRPMPGRTNIVITRNHSYEAPGALVVDDLETGLEVAKKSPGSDEIIVMGGGEIYKAALPYTNRLYLTVIDKDYEADAFFPEYAAEFTKKISEEHHEHEGLRYTYLTLERYSLLR